MLSDEAPVYCYLQRTADDRIAIGGRGQPYVFANGFDPAGGTSPKTVESLTSLLCGLFPAVAGVPIERSWSGVLAVPRDLCASVGYHAASGLAWAGGYVGQGVTAANLAGRTILRDLIGIFQRARAAFGPDSGPMHIAAAVGTPVVSLWGATSAARSAPWGSEAAVIAGAASCSPCYLRRCPIGRVCMQNIGVDTVLETLHTVLG